VTSKWTLSGAIMEASKASNFVMIYSFERRRLETREYHAMHVRLLVDKILAK
jgi:hypothetical protein